MNAVPPALSWRTTFSACSLGTLTVSQARQRHLRRGRRRGTSARAGCSPPGRDARPAPQRRSVALVGTRMTGLRPVVPDAQREVLRILVDRRRAIGWEHTYRSTSGPPSRAHIGTPAPSGAPMELLGHPAPGPGRRADERAAMDRVRDPSAPVVGDHRDATQDPWSSFARGDRCGARTSQPLTGVKGTAAGARARGHT